MSALKRFPELRDLSVDHHHGLLLARKAKLVASGEEDTSPDEMWKEISERFRFELEPHFRVEEEALVPALEAHDKHDMARRLLQEHGGLRRFVTPGFDQTRENLGKFGELLESHIRFEERELFETAQEILTPEELGAVDTASKARRVSSHQRGTP